MTERAVRVCVKDGLLACAARILLEEMGCSVALDSEEAPIITDDPRLFRDEKRVLYVLYGQSSEDIRVLLRPFTEEEFKNAVSELLIYQKGSDRKNAELRLDVKSGRVTFNGKKVMLTERECMLLALLIKNKGKSVSDSEIIEKIWKNETAANSNVAAVYINYLRKKLDDAFGQRLIFRVRGEGYMLKQSERNF